jgi:predicted nuclease with TOPRIM domain
MTDDQIKIAKLSSENIELKDRNARLKKDLESAYNKIKRLRHQRKQVRQLQKALSQAKDLQMRFLDRVRDLEKNEKRNELVQLKSERARIIESPLRFLAPGHRRRLKEIEGRIEILRATLDLK